MRTIKGFNRYKITEEGKIFDTERRRFSPYIPDRDGYRRSKLRSNDGKWKSVSAHREVAIAYIENPDNKECVSFINDNKDDIRVSNLIWTTKREVQLRAMEEN